MAKRKPEIPPVQMPLRVPPDLHAQLGAEAAKMGVSLNAYCVEALRWAVDPEVKAVLEGKA